MNIFSELSRIIETDVCIYLEGSTEACGVEWAQEKVPELTFKM